jgi:hypothetical protein
MGVDWNYFIFGLSFHQLLILFCFQDSFFLWVFLTFSCYAVSQPLTKALKCISVGFSSTPGNNFK